MNRDARISDCGNYRYTLSRSWHDMLGQEHKLGWVMLNPSTADAL